MSRGGIEYENRKNIQQTMVDIRDSTSPWRVSALWRKKGACFHKLRRGGVIRLYRTGERGGFCWADLRMVPLRGGGTAMQVKTAETAKAKLIAWALCTVCLFMVAHDWLEYGSGALVRDAPYLLLGAAAVLLTLMTGRETPKLLQFIEQELGWRRAS